MSSETVQEMIEMVEHNQEQAYQGYTLWCPECATRTLHIIISQGDWEKMVCIVCQNEQAFRVR